MATATSTRSSASAAALAAAISSKPLPSPLPTPDSAGFPSALSPLPSAGFPKSARTPLTPPAAYLDFLRIVDKGLKTPLSSSTSTTFPTSYPSDLKSPYAWPRQPQSARAFLTPLDRTDSTTSNASNGSTVSTSSAPPAAGPNKTHSRRASDPTSATLEEPRTSSAGAVSNPTSGRPSVIRRPSVIIPESPSTQSPSLMSPASVLASNPTSANPPTSSTASRGGSPASATAAKNYYMSLSPSSRANGTANTALNGDATPQTSTSAYTPSTPHGTGVKRPFSVRHVITRTVTYTRPAGTTALVGPAHASETPQEAGQMEGKSDKGDKEQKRTSLSRSFDPVRDSASQERERDREESRGSNEAEVEPEAKPEIEAEAEAGRKERVVAKFENIAARPVTKESWAIPRTPLVGDVPIGKRRKVA